MYCIDDLPIRTWHVGPEYAPDMQIWTSHGIAFENYRLTNRHRAYIHTYVCTYTTEIIYHAASREVKNVTQPVWAISDLSRLDFNANVAAPACCTAAVRRSSRTWNLPPVVGLQVSWQYKGGRKEIQPTARPCRFSLFAGNVKKQRQQTPPDVGTNLVPRRRRRPRRIRA